MQNFVEDIMAQVDDYLLENMTSVLPEQVGLDRRCNRMYISRDGIASTHARNLDYYGGFEYIDSEYRKTIGEVTFYFAGHDRVDECIDRYYSTVEDTVDNQ